mmetsp:Transcript_4005/g.7645  ORF Transcript_4005/g.7645 Transcript_4005/m.7645 type:complete len:82 (+) Transcript_4005:2669-2914(+)
MVASSNQGKNEHLPANAIVIGGLGGSNQPETKFDHGRVDRRTRGRDEGLYGVMECVGVVNRAIDAEAFGIGDAPLDGRAHI